VKLAELAKSIAGHRLVGSGEVDITSVVSDNREAKPGSLFAALRGAKADGHAFAPAAAAAGAAALLVEREIAGVSCAQVIVERTADALPKIASAFYGEPSKSLKLVGVTGTNGKTTTTYLIRAIFAAAGVRAGVIGTVGYVIGGEVRKAPNTTPDVLTIQKSLREMLDCGERAAAMEVSSHALDQGRVEELHFSAGIFTNLTGDHLDYHKTMDAYGAAKAKLFESLAENAFAVLNADDPSSGRMAKAARCGVYRFSSAGNADFCAKVRAESLEGTQLKMRLISREINVNLPLVGRYNISNALGAAAACHLLGVGTDAIARGLGSFKGVPGRLERVSPPGAPVVLVDYAHTDDALINVLSTIRPIAKKKLITVFGCGGDRDRTKRPRMALAVQKFSDFVVVTSDNPRTEDPHAILAEIEKGFSPGAKYVKIADRREAIGCAIRLAVPGDVVLIAGKGHEDYQIFRDRTIHFDDREVSREFLNAGKTA
jgi:UDP-N-acetylmuramyl-tripeptide synthetase